jgi:hypothetical protein
MILHIVPDEKFIDMAYNMFEKASPNNNEFMVVTKQKSFKYIKTTPVTKITPIEFSNKKFMNNLKQYEFVVLHWLDFFKMRLLLKVDKNIKFVWIGWGGDYYDYIKLKNGSLLLPKTEKVSHLISKQNKSVKSHIKSLIKKFYFFGNRKLRAINRINYFAPVLENEYQLMQNSLQRFEPKFLDWNYGTLEDDFIRGYEDAAICGNNILIGNSATLPNNHLEAFDTLKVLNIDNRKVIAPLSYGDEHYANLIIESGKKFFGNAFEPLTEFMEIDEYVQKIASCSVVIMNHLRQQAVGNIIIMLYIGAKVFLNKENPAYIFLKQNGIVLFSLEELTQDQIDTELSIDQIENNRAALRKLWGREVALKKTQQLINTMREI